jgi:hypothetical protein
MDNSIDKALGLRPMEEALSDSSNGEVIEAVPTVIEEQRTEIISANNSAQVRDEQALKDIEFARKNIEAIITNGDSSLAELIELAKQSESPRAYEVVTGMMKTLLDANKDFVDITMKKKYQREELETPKENASSQGNVTNNNLIISTKDLLSYLKDEKSE